MKSINDFKKKKQNHKPISMVTAYDYPTAVMVAESDVDAILVGDSVAMVMHGFKNTTYATPEMMTLHTAAVARGAQGKFMVTDIPFLMIHRGDDYLFHHLDQMIKAGANAVKIEGGEEVFTGIEKVIKTGTPVMGHLGLTPQAVNQMGGYKVQGKSDQEAKKILTEAKKLEELGVFALILECVPPKLAKAISLELNIPVIGIGAGAEVDGQILVIDDLLGKSNSGYPKFVRQYQNQFDLSLNSLNQYHQDVTQKKFHKRKRVTNDCLLHH